MKFDFEISVGEQFQLELASNPTTGYSWKWTNKQAVSVVDTAGFIYIPDSAGRIGGGGKEIWKFKGLKRGIDSVQMEYCRSWAPNSTIQIKTIKVRVL